MRKKGIAILGSTGSIGKQTLEVISQFPDRFELKALTANSSVELLIEQAKKFQPENVVIADKSLYEPLRTALWNEDIKVYTGPESIAQIVESETTDVVVTAMVGYAGLAPTLSAIRAGKIIALANKETLVVAGELITAELQKYRATIIPVDSEHSAIFQCLMGETSDGVDKIILTASGGPFRGYTSEQLLEVTRQQALNHPNWTMGAKITIDSASMMNKGLEVIEAKWLFGLRPEQIDIVIHPQSIIHSLVHFKDGSLKAQLGMPDMRLPIQFALTYPERWTNDFKRFSFLEHPQLTFETPDRTTFKNLDLAYRAMELGGVACCFLNAANEVAVDAFLSDGISFSEIANLNEAVLNSANVVTSPTLDDYVKADAQARELTRSLLR